MKVIVLVLIALILQNNLIAQDCMVTLKASVNTRSFGEASDKPIQFKLRLKDTVLISSTDGKLVISKTFMDLKGNDEVLRFDFFNQLDWEFYREPMFTRTQRTLKEYCDQILVAAPRE